MKAVVSKTLQTLVGLALVVPFSATALLFGARAVAVADGAYSNLLLIGLAICGAAVSVLKSLERPSTPERNTSVLRITPRETTEGHGAALVNHPF